jgi:hypothetical protein
MLDAQWAEPVGADGRILVEHASVVEKHAFRGDRSDMPRPVELGADLADLGGQVLVVVDQLVGAERAAGGQARYRHAPTARAERRCVAGVNFAKRRDLALFHQRHGLEDQFGRGAIDRAGEVVRTKLAGRLALVQRVIVDVLGVRLHSERRGNRERGGGDQFHWNHFFSPFVSVEDLNFHAVVGVYVSLKRFFKSIAAATREICRALLSVGRSGFVAGGVMTFSTADKYPAAGWPLPEPGRRIGRRCRGRLPPSDAASARRRGRRL